MTGVWIRERLDAVLGRFLVPLFGEDEVRGGVICTGRWGDAWDGFDAVGFRG